MPLSYSSVSGNSRPLAFFGDWHRHLGWSLGCIDAAEKAGVETMISVGDCALDWPGANRGRYEKRLNSVLVDKGMRLLVSPGQLGIDPQTEAGNEWLSTMAIEYLDPSSWRPHHRGGTRRQSPVRRRQCSDRNARRPIAWGLNRGDQSPRGQLELVSPPCA